MGMILLVIFTAEMARFIAGKPLIPERWNVWFVAFCFGVQSAVTFPAMGVPTMLATGHMTTVFYAWMEVLLKEKPKENLEKTLYPIVNSMSILIGAGAGAFANTHSKGSIASCFLLTPITVLQLILLELVEFMTRDGTPQEGYIYATHKESERPAGELKKDTRCRTILTQCKCARHNLTCFLRSWGSLR